MAHSVFIHSLCLLGAADIKRIADHILNGPGRHQTYNRLALLGDKFGPRMVGSDALEDAIGQCRFCYYVAARRHIFVCFMTKSAFWRGFSALAPYTGVGPI